jgi:Ca-activated chloride channel family protein
MKYLKIFIFFLLIFSPIFFVGSLREYRIFKQGEKYFAEKEYDKAVEIFGSLSGEKSKYNKNISLYMADKEITEGKEVEELVNQANKLYREKKYEDAKKIYWQGILLSDEKSIKRNYERTLLMLEKESKSNNNEKNKKDDNKKQNKQDKQDKKDGINKNEDKNFDNTNENSRNNKENRKNNQESEDTNNNKDMKEKSSKSDKENGVNEKNSINSDKNQKNNEESQTEKKSDKGNISENEKKENQEQETTKEKANENDLGKDEITSYLEMLSNLEKQDLKNNYRTIRKGDNNEQTKNW